MTIGYGGANGTINESTTSPMTVTSMPAGYASGDLFIAQLLSREDNPTPVHGLTTSAVSWTQIGTTAFLDIGTTGIAQSMWYRFATSGSETAPVATCPTPNTMACRVHYFTGVDSSTPLDGVTVLQGTNAAAATLQPNGGTGITTNTANAWVIATVSTPDDNAMDLSVANGFTERTPTSSATLTDWAQDLAHRATTSAGNYTACTFRQVTNGNDEWAWHLFVLRETQVPFNRQTIVVAPSQAVQRASSW